MPFPPDYFAARARFRAAAKAGGWATAAYPVAAPGPGGEELTIDVARSAAGGPDPVLVVSTGVHGVEGFFGSAVQVAALDEWARAGGPPAGVRCVFVHAVNPWGFAHVRRADDGNVDNNRNYLPAGVAYAGCPRLYARYDRLLNPRRPPAWWDPFPLTVLPAIARHGYGPLKQAVAGGQYEFPRGLFFGGHGPSESHAVVRAHLAGWLGDAAEVVHLDYHTGLGRWGTYKLLIDPPLTPAQSERAARWFGADVLQPSDTAGVAYRSPGGFGPWCAANSPGRDYLFLCAEFGTYGNLTNLAAVRAENQAHHWGRPGDPATRRAKERLREVFCPADPGWRARVVADGVDLIRRAVAGLRRSP